MINTYKEIHMLLKILDLKDLPVIIFNLTFNNTHCKAFIFNEIVVATDMNWPNIEIFMAVLPPNKLLDSRPFPLLYSLSSLYFCYPLHGYKTSIVREIVNL